MPVIEPIAAPAPAGVTLATATEADGGFEARWTAWNARGAAHERDVRRRMIAAATAIVIVASSVYLLLVMW